MTVKNAMAVKPEVWQRLKRSHREPAREAVDSQKHLEQFRMPEDLNALFDDEKVHKPVPSVGGTTKKMIHDVGDDRVMAKPYHPGMESHSREWVKHPIHGWSSLATRALYQAGGLGDLVEEVYAGEHEGIPLTVHRFSKGFNTIYDAKSKEKGNPSSILSKTPNPLQIQQIAAMDFLTGNNDRHSGNLLIADANEDTGFAPLLAIDHERSFQYNKTLPQRMHDRRLNPTIPPDTDSPVDFIRQSPALSTARQASFDNGHADFRAWWLEAGPAIKAEFTKQLSYIKNTRLRSYIEKNFHHRYEIVDGWAQQADHPEDLFSRDFSGKARLLPMDPAPRATVDFLLKNLPDNTLEAIDKIINAFSKRRSDNVVAKLMEVFLELFAKLQPSEVVRLYEKHKNNWRARMGNQSISYTIWKAAYDLNKVEFMKALVDHDNGEGRIPQFWIGLFKDKINANSHQEHAPL